jgi:4-hydroxy-tetrahydrodipicolinate synthase
MTRAALAGDWTEARRLHFSLLPMMHLIFEEGNPTGVKAAMYVQALLENELRLPLISSSANLLERITAVHSSL